MNNYKLDYWIESVSSSIDEIGCKLSTEDITSIAEAMIITAEQESMAFGYDAIPNPLQTEIDMVNVRLKREQEEWESRERKMEDKLKQERRAWHRREGIYLQSIASQSEIDIEEIIIGCNSVVYPRNKS